MIRLKVTPVVGLPQFTGWSQVAESTSSASSRLVSVFAVSGKHAGNVGRDIADKISEFYFYDIEQLHEFIQGLITFAQENDCELFLSVALVNGKKSVFITRGGSVFLKRKDKMGQILFSQDDVKIVEGSYQEGDVFVLTTLQASQFLNEIEQKFIQGFEVDIIITSVVPGLHAQTDSSLSAIVFINEAVEGEDELIQDLDQEPAIEADIDFDEQDDLDQDVTTQDDGLVRVSEEELDSTQEDQGRVANQDQQTLNQERVGIEADFSESGIDVKDAVERVSKLRSGLGPVFAKIFGFLRILLMGVLAFFRRILSLVKAINPAEITKKVRSLRSSGLRSVSRGHVSLDDKPLNKLVPKILVAVVIIALFSGGVFYVIYQSNQEKDRVNSLIQPVQAKVELARTSLDSDPIYSRDLVLEAIASLEAMQEENESSNSINLIDEELEKTNQFYTEISGKKELDELDIFYDLRLVRSDYVASEIKVNNDTLVLLDSEKKQVITLDIASKNVSARDFSNFENVVDVSINEDEVFVLADGIQVFEIVEDSEIREVRNLGDSNRDGTLIAVYDRFLYILNPEKRNLYRYSAEEDGYSDPIGWMRSATGLRYDEVTSLSVDGDVWLATSDGQVKKFATGEEETFELRGLNKEFGEGIKLYTNIDQENLYVLDPDENRVVVLSKTGEFLKEVKSISLGAVGAIAVDEALGKVFAVSGSIIYEINLNE